MNYYPTEPKTDREKISAYSIRKEMKETCLEVATEGAVLLKNENNTLPLKKGTKVCVFGRCAIDYFHCGNGSGKIDPPHTVNLIEGLINYGIDVDMSLFDEYSKFTIKNGESLKAYEWAKWPTCYTEMKVSNTTLNKAYNYSNTAIIVIGRNSGESIDMKLEKGSYYLTDLEEDMIKKVTSKFDRIVLIMNTCNQVDLSFTTKYKFDSIIMAYEGGMESGNALGRLISGEKSFSGRLPHELLKSYDDYPSSKDFGSKDYNNYTEDIFVGYRYSETFNKDSILYPFGYGLSYTTFKKEIISSSVTGTRYRFDVLVKNTGNFKGKEVVEIFLKAPKGKLSKAEKVLVGFVKTKELDVNEETNCLIEFDLKDFSSFDDDPSSFSYSHYVLEKGVYEFYLSNDERNDELVYSFSYDDNILVKKVLPLFDLDEAMVFDRMSNVDGEFKYEKIKPTKSNLKDRIESNLKDGIEPKEYNGEQLIDVLENRITLDEFISKLSLDDLNRISCGEGGMNSSLGTKGNAGIIGGVSQSLRDKGVPPIVTSDGPQGLRLEYDSSSLPVGTMYASSFNLELVEELGYYTGLEAIDKDIDTILAPGMNIHRNPLCGRNFEYYSEDPLLSGLTAAAYIRGIEKTGVNATPKHYFGNNQEVNRDFCDSRISIKAIREIYLRNFEYMLKNSNPRSIMTSYNLVNGTYSHYNYDSVVEFLRKECRFDGLVMTDWWMRYRDSKEFPLCSGNAYRVRSGINVLMPGGVDYSIKDIGNSLLENYGKYGAISLYELQENARYVLEYALNSLALKRFLKQK